MKVRFIVNPVAGGADRVKNITEAVKRLLKTEQGIFDIKVTKGRTDASGYADASGFSRDAVEKGYDAVFACGGDGTINEVARELVSTSTVLGVIPGGSGNGFARSLGLPEDIDSAIGLLKGFKTREIDVGVICGRYFFSTAGCGFDARLSKRYNEGKVSRKVRGLVPYYPLALTEFFRFKPRELTVQTDCQTIKVAPLILTAANTEQYGGGAVIAPGAQPDDGLLDLCIVPMTGLMAARKLARKVLSGKVTDFNGYMCVRTDRIEITGAGDSVVQADGEPFEWRGSITIGILHKKLKVLVG
ncbi:MAG TPA: diacylglycerol kinase family protein [Thermodesulfobacteriota bacterium]|nr:diacylglycerol kinase family protein [Thermodesulfobacteriota bacterium]